ncbi:MAG TPA: hypothetical protein VFX76_22775, partial [Roseiflexaceae bacterium]|nr:hypothetical protein [Roseiflexaceae bacterium]
MLSGNTIMRRDLSKDSNNASSLVSLLVYLLLAATAILLCAVLVDWMRAYLDWELGQALLVLASIVLAGGAYAVRRHQHLELQRTDRVYAAELCAGEERNRALLEASQRQARDLALINRVLVAAASARHPNAVLETICSELAQAFDLPQAAAAVLDAAQDRLTVVAEYCGEGRPSALGAVIRVSENTATRAVIETRTPLAISDAQTDPRQTSFHSLAKQRGTV